MFIITFNPHNLEGGPSEEEKEAERIKEIPSDRGRWLRGTFPPRHSGSRASAVLLGLGWIRQKDTMNSACTPPPFCFMIPKAPLIHLTGCDLDRILHFYPFAYFRSDARYKDLHCSIAPHPLFSPTPLLFFHPLQKCTLELVSHFVLLFLFF